MPPTDDLLREVPRHLLTLAKQHLAGLQAFNAGIARMRALEQRVGSPGRYEYEYRLQREPDAQQSVAWLDRFAALAREHSIDPEAVFTALGGRPHAGAVVASGPGLATGGPTRRGAPRCVTRFAATHCGQVWAAQDLAPISDDWGRVAPGGVVPLGQCPNANCQALCYPPYGYVYDLEQQRTALHDIVSRLLDWAAMMGGWEAPVWEQARRALASVRSTGCETTLDADALTDNADDIL